MICDDGFIELADVQLEYRWIPGENDQRAPVVFLHEGLGSVASWGSFPERIARGSGRSVLLYSRRGYGRSSPITEGRSADYLVHEALTVLPAVLSSMAIRRPVLFGHSDGASIALAFAAAHPEALSGLVLEAPHVFVEDVTIEAIARIGEAAKATDLIAKLGRYHEDPAGAFWGWNQVWLSPEFRHWRITDGLERIRVPMLLIQGEDDAYGSLDQIETVARAAQGLVERLILPACGHSPHREQGRAVEQAVLRFLAARSD